MCSYFVRPSKSFFKQFIKTKRHRFGIKIFVICDVETDFILNILIYTGSTTEYKKTDPSLGISGAVVNKLMKPYLKKGHKLFIDNLYTSPSLAMFLYKKKKKTKATGTVRKKRKGKKKKKTKIINIIKNLVNHR